MVKLSFSDDIKRLKHFSRIDENTWLVQRDKNSMCESYYVTVLPCAIVMYGDYGGVIVKPHECKKEALINWMANATSLNYFCEKVMHGNQHHQTKEFSRAIAENSIVEMIRDKYELSNNAEELIKKASENCHNFGCIESDLMEKIALDMNCHPDNVEADFKDYDKLVEDIVDFLDGGFEQERDYFEFCETHDFEDWIEMPYEDYTFRINFQHQCLLWWARHIQKNKKEVSDSSHN